MAKELEERIAQLEQQLAKSTVAASKNKQSARSKTKLISASVVVLLVILSGIWAYSVIIRQTDHSGPLAQYVASKTIDFPLYYPTKGDSDFNLDAERITFESDVLTFSGTFSSKQLAVAQQIMPKEFDHNLISDAKVVSLGIGKAHITRLGNIPVAIILTEETLITVSAIDADEATLESFIQNF
jgi:hypothetical protein